ncbi:MAG TPA: cell division protein FtsZ, partial [Dehalococcoidia bacterium]|nr:cell division protein FtsZ [Dehalococcoidia bacterium]
MKKDVESVKRTKLGTELQKSAVDEELEKLLSKVKPRILVVGAGGAGNNTMSRLMETGIEGAETIAVNTDAQDLLYTNAQRK